MPDEMETYRTALKQARAHFDASTARLNSITHEAQGLSGDLGRLRRTITALATMCSESPWLDPLGITESCSEVMSAETEQLTTGEVLKKLEGMGFDLATQKNPAASVHAVLSRLAEREEITKETDELGSVVWRGRNYAPYDFTDDDIPF